MATVVKPDARSRYHQYSSGLLKALGTPSSGSGQSRTKYRKYGGNAPGSSPPAGMNYSPGLTSQGLTTSGAPKQGSRPRRRRGPLTPTQQVAAATRRLQLADHHLRLLVDDMDADLEQDGWEDHLHASATAKVRELSRAARSVVVLKKLRFSSDELVTNIWYGFVRVAMGRRELDCVGLPATRECRARGEIRAGIDDALVSLVWLRAALA